MSDALSKVISIFIAAICMFVMPVMYYSDRSYDLERLYIITQTTDFVDAVRNTGMLTYNMYTDYINSVNRESGIYEIEISITREILLVDSEDKVVADSLLLCNEEIIYELEKNNVYTLLLEDFFKVSVTDSAQGIYGHMLEYITQNNAQENVIAIYGGRVKYET